jgi:uroporphyrin-III C-methyltransferase
MFYGLCIFNELYRIMNTATIIPQLYVIGAGPGDPELITIKGYKILQQANVILFDNLANKELLALAGDHCEKIYVGKQPYGDYTSQERILELIKEKAFEKGLVIRLKGGDPFIFGRGYEEMLFAREHGIESFYIPGITSMQASGFENIPLTHRAVSESVWMVTGTKKDGRLSADLKLAMQSNATVVIYMGMKKLNEIVQTYIEAGNADMPAAIIQHASLPHQKSVRGLVKDLPDLVMQHHLTHPAIIIIGRVTDESLTY